MHCRLVHFLMHTMWTVVERVWETAGGASTCCLLNFLLCHDWLHLTLCLYVREHILHWVAQGIKACKEDKQRTLLDLTLEVEWYCLLSSSHMRSYVTPSHRRDGKKQGKIKVRDLIHCYTGILDMVPSSSAHLSPGLRRQLEWLFWNYLRRIGGKWSKKSVYTLFIKHLYVFSGTSCSLFVGLSFLLLCASLAVHSSDLLFILFRELKPITTAAKTSTWVVRFNSWVNFLPQNNIIKWPHSAIIENVNYVCQFLNFLFRIFRHCHYIFSLWKALTVLHKGWIQRRSLINIVLGVAVNLLKPPFVVWA